MGQFGGSLSLMPQQIDRCRRVGEGGSYPYSFFAIDRWGGKTFALAKVNTPPQNALKTHLW